MEIDYKAISKYPIGELENIVAENPKLGQGYLGDGQTFNEEEQQLLQAVLLALGPGSEDLGIEGRNIIDEEVANYGRVREIDYTSLSEVDEQLDIAIELSNAFFTPGPIDRHIFRKESGYDFNDLIKLSEDYGSIEIAAAASLETLEEFNKSLSRAGYAPIENLEDSNNAILEFANRVLVHQLLRLDNLITNNDQELTNVIHEIKSTAWDAGADYGNSPTGVYDQELHDDVMLALSKGSTQPTEDVLERITTYFGVEHTPIVSDDETAKQLIAEDTEETQPTEEQSKNEESEAETSEKTESETTSIITHPKTGLVVEGVTVEHLFTTAQEVEANPNLKRSVLMVWSDNRGPYGPGVEAVQQALVDELGITDPNFVDGHYGWTTAAQVQIFQSQHEDLIPDGIVGPATMAKLFPNRS